MEVNHGNLPEAIAELIKEQAETKQLLKELFNLLSPTTDKSQLKPQSQVLDEFNVSLVTLLSWRKKGLIQAYRIGGRVFYKQSELDQALISIN